MKKSVLSVILSGILGVSALSANSLCEDRLFTISTSTHDGVAVGDLLSQLASECGYSMLIKDRAAQDRLSKSIASVNVRQLPIEKIFDLVLTENELGYEFDGNLLKVSFLVTETFQINYIGTSRVGSSNTDIVLNQNLDTTGTGTGTTGGTGGGTTGGTGGGGMMGGTGGGMTSGMGGMSGGGNIDSSLHNSLASRSMSSSSTSSMSGTKILSIDQFDFWGKIEKEIFEIAFRPGDAHQPQRIFSTTPEQGQSQFQNQNTQNQTTQEKEDIGRGQSVIVNKIAGLVTVTGTIKQIERVRKYIKDLEDQLQSQVMIDVNILTVTHTNSNTVGVDWNQLWNFGNLVAPAYGSDGAFQIAGGGGTQINLFSAGVQLTRIMEFLNQYGKVRSISNPKVLTLSNQPALISVGSILRYNQSTVFNTLIAGGTNTQQQNTTYPSVFSGVLLDVTPSIQGEYIMLKINPSITKVKDANTENAATALQEPPNLSANQLSSLVRARSGDKIVLGGLITKSVTNNTSRVPILGYIPLLKYLFSYDGTSEQTVEMVIVITPHIIKRASDNPSLQDLGYSETVHRVVETNDAAAGLAESKEKDRQKDL